MSLTSTYTAHPATGLMSKFRTTLDAYRAHRADQRAMRQTFNELSAMNDRDLADIGLSRGEIRHIASQAVAAR
jgi:uncharacterized protein YjiS (DUF1127 family)